MSTTQKPNCLETLVAEAVALDEGLPLDSPVRLLLRRLAKAAIELVIENLIDKVLPLLGVDPSDGSDLG